MSTTLYFLRSSEQKIVTDMLHFAYNLDKANKKLEDFSELEIYNKKYGLTANDLGLYALDGHTVAGGAWIRLLQEDDNANAFIDDKTPILTIGVRPEFRGKGIGSAMLEQLFLEAGALYEQISVSVLDNKNIISYFEKFDFTKVEASNKKSHVNGSDVITMIKKLSNDPLIRPTDGYDPTKWMD